MKTNAIKSTAALIHEKRRDLGISQLRLAQLAGVGLSAIRRAEVGDLSYKTAARVAPHLGVDVTDLLAGVRV